MRALPIIWKRTRRGASRSLFLPFLCFSTFLCFSPLLLRRDPNERSVPASEVRLVRSLKCVQKRKKLDELDEERKRLEQDLMSQEAKLVELHKDHVDVVEVQLQGKKKQKLEFEQKLQRKMHAIQRMQQEYV